MKYKIFLLLIIIVLIGCTSQISKECIHTKNGCCIGDICHQAEIQCAPSYESSFIGCDENCQEKLTCVSS